MRRRLDPSIAKWSIQNIGAKSRAIHFVADQFGKDECEHVWRWWKRNFGRFDEFPEETEKLVQEFLRYFQSGNFAIRRVIAQILGGKSLRIAPKTSVGGLLRLLHKRGDSPWPIPKSLESFAPPPPLPDLAPVVSKFRWRKSSPDPARKLIVDLRKEATEISSLLSKCMDWYAQKARESSMPQVCAIGAGFYLCQAGWLRPYLELNPKLTYANWASFKQNEIVRLAHWRKIHNHAKRSGCEFILTNGRRITVKPNVSCERLAAIFGGMIRDVLREMRKEGQFEKLPLRDGYYLFADEFDGLWGWRENKQTKTC
jgi:hypothetical protein